MMLTSVDELNKILRQVIIQQSNLSDEQVLNSLSIHGEDLDKLFEEQEYISIDRSDALILFELQSRRSSADISMTNDDGSITLYRSFTFRVMIYGNDSSNIANVLIARLRTEDVRVQLLDSNIYVEKVSEPDVLNEYKNQTMWIRNDIAIDISCEFNISQFMSDNFEQINTTKIYNVGEKQ